MHGTDGEERKHKQMISHMWLLLKITYHHLSRTLLNLTLPSPTQCHLPTPVATVRLITEVAMDRLPKASQTE